MGKDFMDKPCKDCPFRNDVTPFLHPERAEDLAYSTQNPYNNFWCHKTTEYDDSSEDGDMMAVETSKTCAGFLTMMANNDDSGLPEGFEPSWDIVYSDPYEMADAYEIEWNKKSKNH